MYAMSLKKCKSDLMSGRLFAVEGALDADSALVVDRELAPAVRGAVDGVRHPAAARLVGVGGLERFERLAHFGVLVDRHLNVGSLKLRLVVVDVTQLDHHPRVRHVVLVIVVVLTLQAHTNANIVLKR